jgi:aspartate kinase
MKVFKFGGASVNSASAVKNVAAILTGYKNEKSVVVFSAMAKTTNALEKFVKAAFDQLPETRSLLAGVMDFHLNIVNELFADQSHIVFEQVGQMFRRISNISAIVNCSYDEFYDRIVPFGELLSTAIIGHYLNQSGIIVRELPAGEMIITNNRFRDAAPDWKTTEETIRLKTGSAMGTENCNAVITQGFIGATADGRSTTLGREGSDFTASILAYCLDADEVVVWKDVDGLLNADPAYFNNTVKIDHLSYHEAIELSFYGAKILHPKTIKPLQNKSIPLRIKSFDNIGSTGTLIDNRSTGEMKIPFLIKKSDQMVISFTAKDFSFIAEDKLHRLFGVFDHLNLKINLMQNSAISFTIVTNHLNDKLELLMQELDDEFDIRYNEHIELLTIRYFYDTIIDQELKNKRVLLEQRSRRTLQVAYLSEPINHN